MPNTGRLPAAVMKDNRFDIYNLNQPLLPVFRKKFNFLKLRREKSLEKINVNERIVEIPFVLENLHLAGKENFKILDVGCMESALPLMLASLGHEVYAIDIRRYPYTHPRLVFLSADICSMPFKAQVFDAVVAVSVVEHLGLGAYGDSAYSSADITALEKISGCLKNGGLLFLTVPFGRRSVNKQQRVYDIDSLKKLFGGIFTVKKMEFSVLNNAAGGNPSWEITSLKEAAGAEPSEKANAVALCVLEKEFKQI